MSESDMTGSEAICREKWCRRQEWTYLILGEVRIFGRVPHFFFLEVWA